MSDVNQAEIEVEHPGPKAPKVKRRRKVAKKKSARPVQYDEPPAQPKQDDFAGITSTQCPLACVRGYCAISTTGICKHPNKAGDSGCGPTTMRNRERAAKIIKRQAIDK